MRNKNINYLIRSQEIYKQGLKYVKNAGNPVFLQRVSEIYYEYGHFTESLSMCVLIIKRFPNYQYLPNVIFLSSIICKYLHNYKTAVDYLQHIVSLPPKGLDESDIYFITSLILDNANNIQKVASYKKYFSCLPENRREIYGEWENAYNDSLNWELEGDKLSQLVLFKLFYRDIIH